MKEYLKQWISDPSINKFVSVIAAILAIIFVVTLLKGYLTRFIEDTQSRYYVRKVITFLGYLLGFLILAISFSDRLRNISVVIGIAGAGIAFALQEVIASVAGRLAISFSSFYSVGDRVQLGGIKGDVIDIGLLRTTLMECGEWIKSDLYTGRIVRVANSFIFKEPVFNYSGDFPFLWDEITIPVKHGSDHVLARNILQRIADEAAGEYIPVAATWWKEMIRKYRIEDAKIEPIVTLVVTDNWLGFSVRYVVDYKKRRVTKDQMFYRILEEFEKTDGKVTIASTTLHIVEAPHLKVTLTENRKAEI
jgi:small-conductance mechanosensitive channel